MATLTRLDGPGGRAEPIAIGDKLTIGRGRDNTLMIEDTAISRRHARIVRREQGYQLLDLGSENGTWVGDRRIQEYWLRPGDRIRVGETVFRFLAEAGDPVPTGAGGGPSPVVLAGCAALAIGTGLVVLAASTALWYLWPKSDTRAPAPPRQDCYDVCFRRCRALGDDSAGPWCNDLACCAKACTPMRGLGDPSLSYRECQALTRP